MYLLPASRINDWWPEVEPLLLKAYLKTNVGLFREIDDLKKDLESEVEFCFVSQDLTYAGVFNIREYQGFSVVYFWLSGGEEPLVGWEGIDSFLHQIAKVFGCSHIQLEGRLGWKRLTEPLGYSLDSIIMIKEVDNESIAIS